MSPRSDAVRLLQYAVCFVGLMVFLFAVWSLSSLLLSQLIPDTRSLVTGSSLRQQVSYYLAALIVATPLWLVFRQLVQRRVERDPAERRAPERHLFFALVSAIGAVAALFAVHTVLRVVFSLPVEHETRQVLQDLAPAAIRLIVYGLASAWAARAAWRESRLQNAPQDLALFVVSGFAAGFLVIGTLDALTLILAEVMGAGSRLILGVSASSSALAWAQTAAWIMSGGAVWAAATAFDNASGARRHFRLVYLYVVLAVAVAMTLISGTDLLYELLRRALGYRTPGTWHVLQDTVPWLVVGAALWIYHWGLLRHWSSTDRAASVPPERRLAVAGYALAGLAMVASAAAVLLWLILDSVFGTHPGTLEGTQWWVDRLSAGVAIMAVGVALWAPSWRLWQQAAADPEVRSSFERRWLIGGVTLLGALASIGFTIAFLWTLLQVVLGGGFAADSTSHLFKYLGTALIALTVTAYYGSRLRSDMRLAPSRRARIVALVEPGGEARLDAIRRTDGRRLRVIGYLAQPAQGHRLDAEALQVTLQAPATDRLLLILGPDGALVYPYTQSPGTDPQQERPKTAPLPAAGS
jgi:hypothetical protein